MSNGTANYSPVTIKLEEPDYVVVNDPNGGEMVELPTDPNDNTLALVTLEHAFPGAHGLKYKNPKTGASRALMLDPTGTRFMPPAGGWCEKVFMVILRAGNTAAPTTESSNDYVKSSDDQSTKAEVKDEGKKKSESSSKKFEDKPVCSDLIVLGLPWKTNDDELREYFEQFGPVTMCQIKTNEKKISRGFGFVRMLEYIDQLKVLGQAFHVIGKRKCTVRLRLSKPGDERGEPDLNRNPKVFVNHLPQDVSKERLSQFFTNEAMKLDENCSVLDVYLNKSRNFAFVTFSSPAVAHEMLDKKEIELDGTFVTITPAAPKGTDPKSFTVNTGIAPRGNMNGAFNQKYGSSAPFKGRNGGSYNDRHSSYNAGRYAPVEHGGVLFQEASRPPRYAPYQQPRPHMSSASYGEQYPPNPRSEPMPSHSNAGPSKYAGDELSSLVNKMNPDVANAALKAFWMVAERGQAIAQSSRADAYGEMPSSRYPPNSNPMDDYPGLAGNDGNPAWR
ncbi:RNA recognition motif domain-containing protein [Ditylenchus destructor]|uniref:RNA recognition motif domain-containing protein n=1 Tax=Ditylenchus destructor TaxID=166010 RepID=A0AAD4NA02_9BILA|nr:RNA recognition motif domain-containing protein [Ditylenchus destructor]